MFLELDANQGQGLAILASAPFILNILFLNLSFVNTLMLWKYI